MPCERTRAQLTAYLDGELDADDGTVVRGHLRTCEACRAVAEDESALRDGLRELPSVDPPSTLWANVQARLADEEVREARRPAWRRALARWRRFVPAPSRLAFGGFAVAAAVTLIVWKTQQQQPAETTAQIFEPPAPIIKPDHPKPPATPDADISEDLDNEPARISATYAKAIDELVVASSDVRPSWTDDRKAAFDAKIQTMRGAIASATEGKPRHRASRALIRYLEGAVIREDVLLASRGDR